MKEYSVSKVITNIIYVIMAILTSLLFFIGLSSLGIVTFLILLFGLLGKTLMIFSIQKTIIQQLNSTNNDSYSPSKKSLRIYSVIVMIFFVFILILVCSFFDFNLFQNYNHHYGETNIACSILSFFLTITSSLLLRKIFKLIATIQNLCLKYHINLPEKQMKNFPNSIQFNKTYRVSLIITIISLIALLFFIINIFIYNYNRGIGYTDMFSVILQLFPFFIFRILLALSLIYIVFIGILKYRKIQMEYALNNYQDDSCLNENKNGEKLIVFPQFKYITLSFFQCLFYYIITFLSLFIILLINEMQLRSILSVSFFQIFLSYFHFNNYSLIISSMIESLILLSGIQFIAFICNHIKSKTDRGENGKSIQIVVLLILIAGIINVLMDFFSIDFNDRLLVLNGFSPYQDLDSMLNLLSNFFIYHIFLILASISIHIQCITQTPNRILSTIAALLTVLAIAIG